jgi:hypothetical protein
MDSPAARLAGGSAGPGVAVMICGRAGFRRAGGLGGELVEDGAQALQLVEVGGGQPGQPALAAGGEPDPGEAAVVVIALPLDQPGRLGAVDQLDGAMQPQQQVAGQVTGGRAVPAALALDRQQQLALGRSQSRLAGAGLGPVQEAAQPGAEG